MIERTANVQYVYMFNQSDFFIHRQIDAKQEKYIKRLADTVAIKSVSAWPETRPEIVKMVKWTQNVNFLKISDSTVLTVLYFIYKYNLRVYVF